MENKVRYGDEPKLSKEQEIILGIFEKYSYTDVDSIEYIEGDLADYSKVKDIISSDDFLEIANEIIQSLSELKK